MNASASLALNLLIGSKLTLRLFSVESQGVHAEIAGPGYEPVALKSASWIKSSEEVRHHEVVFRFTEAAGSVAGYFLTSEADPTWQVVERFKEPYEIAGPGDAVTVRVRIKGTMGG